MVFRAAFWYSSLAELHIRSRTKVGYSVRIGIGTTATSLWRETLRFDLVFFDTEVKLGCEVSVKVPSDATEDGK